MSKPTQGPWKVSASGLTVVTEATDPSAFPNGRTVATTAASIAAVRCPQERKANARLMAASHDLLAVALAYEQWEAEIVMDNASWQGDLPALTQKQFDRLLEIQAMRNAAVAKAKGG